MNQNIKPIALIFFFYSMITSSGCATGVSGETVVGTPESPMWHKSASIQTKIAHFKDNCLAYGIIDGTPQMSSCLQSEIQNSKNSAQKTMNAINAANAIRQNSNKSYTCQTYGNTTRCH